MKTNGLGFGTILFLIFLTLKLTNNIQWSWVWVTSPLWIPIVIVGLAVVLLALISKKK
jgi:hypothetical protein